MTDNPRLVVNDENLIKMVTLQAKNIGDLELENQRLEDRLKLANDTLKELKERGLI